MVERGGRLSLRRQSELLGLSRSSLYYTPRGASAEDLGLMRRLDELYLEHPFYGSRQDGSSSSPRGYGGRSAPGPGADAGDGTRGAVPQAAARAFRTRSIRVYPYLLRGVKVERPDHVWCADLTCIPVSQGYLYLVAVMDWASRHVLSWRLSNTMDSQLCIEALEAALGYGTPQIFNTDQGAQFTSEAFTERVLACGARCSMDGRGLRQLSERNNKVPVQWVPLRLPLHT